MRNIKGVDEARLWQSLLDMAEIGATPKGGVRRLAASDEDRLGRNLFVKWCEAAGLKVTVDAMGNIFARREGRDPARPAVLVGSHLDTVPTGGKFDGAYGTLAALELVRAMNDGGIETEAPVEIVAWSNEEGARFAPAMMGSAVFTGVISKEEAYARQDKDGLRFGDELARIGYVGAAPVGGREIGAYFEAHIEQGDLLERQGAPVGIVTGVQGIRDYDVTVTGFETHAGPMPMDSRRDAVFFALPLMQGIYDMALARSPLGRATVGEIRVEPGARNVVASRLFFTIDFRHPEEAEHEKVDAELSALVEQANASGRVEVACEQVFYAPPVVFDAELKAMLARGAEAFDYAAPELLSGAGHDAAHMAQVCPSAMVFIPCKAGLSHNEAESITAEHAAAGANVLLSAVLERAGG